VTNDTVSDMLTRIRNANNSKHHLVQVPATKMTRNIVSILKEEGFIEDFELLKEEQRTSILISLKYAGKKRQPVITTLKRVSKSGLRVYSRSNDLPNILGNFGIAIVSTSKGVMTNIQAKKLGVGGEILCYIW
jgi:small subunit ribosomal protein S8